MPAELVHAYCLSLNMQNTNTHTHNYTCCKGKCYLTCMHSPIHAALSCSNAAELRQRNILHAFVFVFHCCDVSCLFLFMLSCFHWRCHCRCPCLGNGLSYAICERVKSVAHAALEACGLFASLMTIFMVSKRKLKIHKSLLHLKTFARKSFT